MSIKSAINTSITATELATNAMSHSKANEPAVHPALNNAQFPTYNTTNWPAEISTFYSTELPTQYTANHPAFCRTSSVQSNTQRSTSWSVSNATATVFISSNTISLDNAQFAIYMCAFKLCTEQSFNPTESTIKRQWIHAPSNNNHVKFTCHKSGFSTKRPTV
jgi:hypothetical protein